MSPLPDALQALVEQRLDALELTGPARTGLAPLLLASDFAFEQLQRVPEWRGRNLALPPSPPALAESDRSGWPTALRRYRRLGSLCLIQRDVCGIDSVEQTLAGASQLADACIGLALDAVESQLAARHGRVPDARGRPQRLCVLGLGKLGGFELNFSSDVDLVLAYRSAGSSDGAAPLDHERWFSRAAQQFVGLLSETTAEGFAYRVDLRLRPFGSAGRVALSFAAMEQYFQREGRDWERYAWLKARPVGGDLDAGAELLESLRPFVFRRYLDYTAFAGLREMKALIAAEVARRELSEHIKLGPGGIREIEFTVQLLQLIRGGREPELRVRGLLPALAALRDAGHLDDDTAIALAEAYRFLRRLENRLQMLRDAQTHELPEDASTRARLAAGLGFPDWEALYETLQAHRQRVSAEFGELLAEPKRSSAAPGVLTLYWQRLPEQGDAAALAAAGMAQAEAVHAQLIEFARSAGVRGMSARSRRRLDQVLPALLETVASAEEPERTVARLLHLLHAILRRSSYLALLEEQPAALARLVDTFARSALLADRLSAHPLLLDELLDTRSEQGPPPRAEMQAAVQRALEQAEDIEAALVALNELRQSFAFRLGLAALNRRGEASAIAAGLTDLAEVLLQAVLGLAQGEVARQHGVPPGAGEGGGMLVIGYGSLGGRELGFGSDLDLVFLFDPEGLGEASDGPRPLELHRYFAKLAQRLISLLGTLTPAGRLYEIDLRLRPDGAKGLLVSTLQSYADYQRERAWTWEHQALVRARAIAGDARLAAAFERIRAEVLQRARGSDALLADVVSMRRRMRAELDRSTAARFDLKQGEGGLVDLEFLLQALVLQHAAQAPALLAPRASEDLLAVMVQAGLMPTELGETLRRAHADLLARAIACSLDARPRLVPPDAAVDAACDAIRRACARHGLAKSV
jgi:[glutamine synthetase] adenylyltransferase / [glutamine synthetase]-adenylyl-L-tyrosine phosphorylase